MDQLTAQALTTYARMARLDRVSAANAGAVMPLTGMARLREVDENGLGRQALP